MAQSGESAYDMYIAVRQQQADTYKKVLAAVQLAEQPQATASPDWDMTKLDAALCAQLKDKLASTEDGGVHKKGIIADHLYKGAIFMRGMRDRNIAKMSPRQRLLAGYNGLFVHEQSLQHQLQAAKEKVD